MTGERNTDRSIRDWLADDVDVLPNRVLDAVVAELPVARQERRRLAWLPSMAPVRLAAMAAALVAAVAVGLAVVGSPAGIGAPGSTTPVPPPPSPSPAPSPTPAPTPTVAPGYGSAPPGWPTNGPLVLASPLPSPDGDPLPADLVGREYNTDPLDTLDSQALVLTLRGADDPHCVGIYGGASTCFTILWTPNYPSHQQDRAVRGSARIVDGKLVLSFDEVPSDLACEGTSSTYTVSEDGWTIDGIDVPACSFGRFVRHSLTGGSTVYDTAPLGDGFDLPLTMSLPEGWIALAAPMYSPNGALGFVKTGNPPDDSSQWWGFGFNLVDGASVADPADIAKPSDVTKMPWPSSYIDYLVDLPGVVVVQGPRPTTVDGVEARQVIVQTPPMHPTIFLKDDYAWLGGGATGIDGAFGRLVIELTVDGKRLLIEDDDAPERFDEHLPAVEDVIRSIAFTK